MLHTRRYSVHRAEGTLPTEQHERPETGILISAIRQGPATRENCKIFINFFKAGNKQAYYVHQIFGAIE